MCFKGLARFWWIVPALFVSAAFLDHWSLYYNSDTALIGLMAHDVLAYGDRPIFVWGVGYMGVLVEVYGTALVFKILGLGPVQLNVVSTLFFLLFVWIFFYSLRRVYGYGVAATAAACCGLMGPTIYGYWLRPIPNYIELIVLGTLFLDRAIVVRSQASRLKFNLFICGALFGLGYYINQQFIYFIAVLVLYYGLAFVVETGALTWRFLWPFIFYFVLSTTLYVADAQVIGPIKWQGYSSLKLSVILLAAAVMGQTVFRQRKYFEKSVLIKHWSDVVAVLIGVLSGQAIEIYARLFRDIQTVSRSKLGKSFPDFVQSLKWIAQGYGKYFGVWNGSEPIPQIINHTAAETVIDGPMIGPLDVAAIAVLLMLFAVGVWGVLCLFRQKKGNQVHPLVLLPFVVIPATAMAKITMGYPNSRYAAAAVPGVIVLLVLGGRTVLRYAMGIYGHGQAKAQRSAWRHGIFALFVGLLLLPVVNAVGKTYIKLSQHQAQPPLLVHVAELQRSRITYTKEPYWQAYAGEFLSRWLAAQPDAESQPVLIEPEESNYNPRRYTR